MIEEHIILRNDLEEISRLRESVDDLGAKFPLSVKDSNNILLALEEIVSNIVRYAFDDGNDHPIDLHIRLAGNRLTLTVSDSGKPFNPLDHPSPDPTLPLEERPIGGLGIFLVRNLFMDGFAYRRENGRNVLTLTKLLHSPDRQ